MSNIICMLEQMAINTDVKTNRSQVIKDLSASCQLAPELEEAIEQADLSGLILMAGMPDKGCFVIVAPDEPDQPDDKDEPDDNKKIRQH